MNVDTTNAPKRTFPKVEPTEREIDDCWILFFHEYVLGESPEVEDNIWWELLTLVSSHNPRVFLECVSHA